jgi:pyruvate/2-oxoglutarate dehydrogenase complex dihydrolipoamide acyltransferase (E2) component
VRELAKKHRVDLGSVAGGTDGRITRADVLRAIDNRNARPAMAPSPMRIASASTGDDEVVPLTRVRRLIAENMTLSKTTIPHAWQSQEVDMSGVVASRSANKERFQEKEGFSLSLLPYVVSAAAAALRAHPLANSSFRPEGIVIHKAINIGVAIGLEDGVIVPVIRSADGMSITDMARVINDLTQRARAKKLVPDDLSGATFTVNNSGTFGTIISYSVISPGQAGILTMGAIKDRVVALDGRIAIRPMMFLSFSLDHRILDGLGGARFLSACREWLGSIQADTALA